MNAGPLSRPLIVATVPPQGQTVEIVADAAELAALAALNEVQSVESLVARLEARPAGRDGLSVSGLLEARAIRICVVTLDPFEEAIREEIDVRFVADGDPRAKAEDFGVTDDVEDVIVGGVVDLGAVAAEFFTLALDPYPRKPGATFDDAAAGDPGEASPFAALRGLARRDGEPD